MTAAALTVLGSGTLLPDGERSSASMYLEVGETAILLDCGSGTLHRLGAFGVRWQEIDVVAVTHFHGDHIGDLAALMGAWRFVGRERPLVLIGPPGFGGLLERLAAAFGSYVLTPHFDLEVIEIEAGAVVEPSNVSKRSSVESTTAAIRLSAVSTPHTAESVAYRISGGWGTLGYTGDTGPSQTVADHLRGCAVLISECALTDPPNVEGHLSPSGVADLARIAEPDLLVLTHVYPPQTPSEAVEAVRAEYEGSVVAAHDGLHVRISSGRVSVDP